MSGIFTKFSEFRESLFRGKEGDETDEAGQADSAGEAASMPAPTAEAGAPVPVPAIPDPDELEFDEGKREYSGMPGNYQVVIRPVYNHIFLSRKYGTQGQPSIKMSWRFNLYGRLDLVDARLLPEKDVNHLIKIRHFEQLTESWSESIAFHYELPERVFLLNPGFRRLSYPRKYQSIMRFGHSMARDVIASLESGAVRDSYVLGEQQEQLRDLVKDDAALCLLRQASLVLPSIKMLNRTVMKVYYTPREE